MTSKFMQCIMIFSLAVCLRAFGVEAQIDDKQDLTDEMKQSLVHLNVSSHGYSQFQPWKRTDIVDNFGFGCAVGPYEVLTTAWNVVNAVHIKARRHGKNEFIPATVKVIDYETNLCLLELEKDAAGGPLKPVAFDGQYDKGAELKSYWLSSGGHLTTGRGYLDRAEVNKSTVSFARVLNFVVSNSANSVGRGEIFAANGKLIGISYWANGDVQEAGLIPAETINRFLADASDGSYGGFGVAGFSARSLIDPAMRKYLKIPPETKHGVYISRVFSLGTGSDVLEEADVLLAIDGKTLNPYGRYEHRDFDRISFRHLISSRNVGDTMKFDIWRKGKRKSLKVKVKNFKASEMLVPYYEFGTQPEYIITAGFVIQKLTRSYLTMWGDGWPGKVPPHLYNYFQNTAFTPTADRKEIVVLSHVLPAPINLGYQGLGRMVVDTFNGMKITCMGDILEAKKLNPDSKFDVIEFEHDYPTVVIPRGQAGQADAIIARNYGIEKLVNIR